ncbi:hypothetical protein LCGC14_1686750 [marine sediment metagenome]|uniref:Uncharacterized protein n=1 Tax=marine sediment metagenome TaxID=412755 RepID=A0A0F9I9H9_9ZZZZ
MIITKPDISKENQEKAIKINKKIDDIGNKFKETICKKIDKYLKKIGISGSTEVLIDIKCFLSFD